MISVCSVAKKKRQTNDDRQVTIKHRCAKHPERYAAVESHGINLCWECRLGMELFKHRFGRDADTFYQPGGPGYAGGINHE